MFESCTNAPLVPLHYDSAVGLTLALGRPYDGVMDDQQPSAAPGFAAFGCIVTGIASLIFAFKHLEVLGLFAALLAFGIVVVAGSRK